MRKLADARRQGDVAVQPRRQQGRPPGRDRRRGVPRDRCPGSRCPLEIEIRELAVRPTKRSCGTRGRPVSRCAWAPGPGRLRYSDALLGFFRTRASRRSSLITPTTSSRATSSGSPSRCWATGTRHGTVEDVDRHLHAGGESPGGEYPHLLPRHVRSTHEEAETPRGQQDDVERVRARARRAARRPRAASRRWVGRLDRFRRWPRAKPPAIADSFDWRSPGSRSRSPSATASPASGEPAARSACRRGSTRSRCRSRPLRDYSRISDEADRKEHVFHFCPECGSQVFYTEPTSPDLIVVSTVLSADPSFPPPTESGYDLRRHSWIQLPDTIEARHRGVGSGCSPLYEAGEHAEAADRARELLEGSRDSAALQRRVLREPRRTQREDAIEHLRLAIESAEPLVTRRRRLGLRSAARRARVREARRVRGRLPASAQV